MNNDDDEDDNDDDDDSTTARRSPSGTVLSCVVSGDGEQLE